MTRIAAGMILPVTISLEDANHAHDEWGCNCGPAALAAIMGLTLDQVRPLMGDFEHKRYTNPTLMFASLDRAGAKWKCQKLGSGFGIDKIDHLSFPKFGVARIQWEGPWTKPSVPIRVRYRHTHWVGAQQGIAGVGIFDINCCHNGCGWTPFEAWRDVLVPWLLDVCEPGADGRWHITHSVEVERPRAEQ